MFTREELDSILEAERADRIAQAKREAELQELIERERLALLERRRIDAAGCNSPNEFEEMQARPGYGIF